MSVLFMPFHPGNPDPLSVGGQGSPHEPLPEAVQDAAIDGLLHPRRSAPVRTGVEPAQSSASSAGL